MDFVRRSNPVVDWSRFRMVEPLPFIRDETFYWKIVVIPNDAAGIAYQAFVNSRTNDVTELKTDEEILSFIRAGTVEGKAVIGEELEKTRDEKILEIKQKLAELQKLIEELE
jgi:hypothetical protein